MKWGGGYQSVWTVFFSPSDEAVLVPGSHEVDVAHQFCFFKRINLSWITVLVICAAFTDCDNEDCMRSEAVFFFLIHKAWCD